MGLIKTIIKENQNAFDFFEKELYKSASKNNVDLTEEDVERYKSALEQNNFIDEDEYPFMGQLIGNSLQISGMSTESYLEMLLDVWVKARNKIFTSGDYPSLDVEELNSVQKLKRRIKEWQYIRFYQKNTDPEPNLSSMSWDEALESASNMYD